MPQLEQRINIMFCYKLGWNFTQIRTSLTAVYGARALSDATIYHWMREFRKGRTRIVDQPRRAKVRRGRSIANVRKVESMVAEDRRVTIPCMSNQSGLSMTTIHRILRLDLKLVKKCVIFVPHLLEDQHKVRRARICSFMNRLKINTPRVFSHVVTMDEAWIYVYDPDLKVHSREWLRQGEACPQKPRRELSTAKVMLVAFFDCHGMVYHEYLQRPQTMNQIAYQALFRRFHDAFLRRRPRGTVHGRWFIHMDNAPPHNATNTLNLMQALGWTCLPQPPYSLDLVPCDFWLFSRIKKDLRGRRYPNLAAVREACDDQIAAISSEEYKHAIMVSWPKRWRRRCLAEQGNYFEGLP